MAMDDVVGEEHRDTQATAQRRLLHRTVFRATTELKVAPIRPAAISSRMRSRGMSPPMLIRRSWPTFSSKVMRPTRSAMKADLSSTEGAAASRLGRIKAEARAKWCRYFIESGIRDANHCLNGRHDTPSPRTAPRVGAKKNLSTIQRRSSNYDPRLSQTCAFFLRLWLCLSAGVA